MPQDEFIKVWNSAAGLNYVAQILKVKQAFNVSYMTVIHRLIECGAAGNTSYQLFHSGYSKLFQRKIPAKSEPLKHACAAGYP